MTFDRLNMPLLGVIPVIVFFIVFALRTEPVDLGLVFFPVNSLFEVAIGRSGSVNVIDKQRSHGEVWIVN